MEAKDIIFTPIYLVLIYVVAYLLRHYLTDNVTKKYFIPTLTIKMIGAIMAGLVYHYYYRYGDTLRYHYFSQVFSETLLNDPLLGIKLLLADYDTTDPELVAKLYNNYFYLRDKGGFFMLKVCGVFGVFNMHSYYSIAIFFAFFSFFGVWVLYLTFYNLYPTLHKMFAWSFLFIPSVIFWGSGIFKDTITFACIGWLTYSTYSLLFGKNKNLLFFLPIVISSIVIITLKIYIILCFIPGLILWVFNSYIEHIKYKLLKLIITPFVLLLAIVIGYYLVDNISYLDEKYTFENLEETMRVTADWITYSSGQGGSFYSLGDDFDLSFVGIATKIPAGINVTLFRPYIWEVNGLVMLFAALESLVILIFTVYVVVKIGPFNLFQFILRYANTKFLFVYSLSFAFLVGISTYNFGSLVRYKIPCIPFYLAFLFISLHIYTSKKGEKTQKRKLKTNHTRLKVFS